MPKKGETIKGTNFSIYPGGKGANQAVAIAKLGGDIQMLGCVGDDVNSTMMLDNLKKNGVKIDYIKKVQGVPTGTASITVAEDDNCIIVVPGANEHVNKSYIDSVMPQLLNSKYVLIQYEIPMETVEYVIDICTKNDIKVVVNPAPVQKLDIELLKKVQHITPNEHEAMLIFDGYNDINDLLKDYPEQVIVTLGEKGAAYSDGEKIISVPIIEGVNVVDTTGAGDTFSGALVKALSDDMSITDAITFAQWASGMSVEKFGAQEGMPTISELEARRGY
jgi:ribokinase